MSTPTSQGWRTATQCVHSGTQIDGDVKGVNTPIHTSSAFGYGDPAKNKYPRYFNTPNQQAVVDKLCALEGAEAGLLFSSGMAAISAMVLGLLQQGDHLVIPKEIYGGSYNFFRTELPRFGINFTLIDDTTPEAYAAAIEPSTRALYMETPSNPLLKLTDIAAVARLARERGLLSFIDNTFASPINQLPLQLGVDVVMHSGTKYFGGHSDLCFGVLLGKSAPMKKLFPHAVNTGGSLNAQTCALIERSLKTLEIRVERQTQNAQRLAEFLEQHPGVVKVNYPGLPSHPQHQLAKEQMLGFGAMLSFEVAGGGAAADALLERLQIIMPALSLGGVESLICSPRNTSHLKMSAQERAQAGISDGLLRLSVGIEAAEDLMADLDQALG
ncbi:trans-sulfuration enzyme family protein [Cesiribacter andamanensis]|uniref:Cystathionine beta-lyase metC n=1 Tax=Cesiribacter andamanensis AMV16 TaxID=1279009 RepID=M7N3M4_9BACT|nr:PLP-dependent aspartate aminotransferase family protein [Cesiribacter andamanensis]EMR01897.1 Cystathionine beta-lyase metC [Cesiribacter andamanensis AMV16]